MTIVKIDSFLAFFFMFQRGNCCPNNIYFIIVCIISFAIFLTSELCCTALSTTGFDIVFILLNPNAPDQFLLHNLILILISSLCLIFFFFLLLHISLRTSYTTRLRKISSSSLSGSITTAFDNQSLLAFLSFIILFLSFLLLKPYILFL